MVLLWGWFIVCDNHQPHDNHAWQSNRLKVTLLHVQLAPHSFAHSDRVPYLQFIQQHENCYFLVKKSSKCKNNFCMGIIDFNQTILLHYLFPVRGHWHVSHVMGKRALRFLALSHPKKNCPANPSLAMTTTIKCHWPAGHIAVIGTLWTPG